VWAKIQYESALALFSGDPRILTRLAEVNRQLVPPDKRIVVSISRQRMYLYLDGQLVKTWICSTGEPGRDTKPGHYKIQSKMPLAYASVWNLDMPYWLGIYYAGASENGIHGPPVQRSTGQKMWEGLLGYRVSYGCIILSEENAKALYEWASYFTPVDVVR
jgi:lipoprotein-anchoring transpeptidase ErfK/SrfK